MKSKSGEGREFIGKMAIGAKLADKVGTYESALRFAQKQVKSAKDNKTVASTVLASTDLSENAEIDSQGTDMKSKTKPTFSAEQLAAIEAGVDVESEQVEDTQVTQDTAVLGAAKAELVTLQATIVDVQASNATLTAEVAALKDVQSKLASIVATATTNMAVAFGESKEACADLPVDQLLAKHAELSAQFKTKFKVGSVAATAPIEEKVEAKAAPFDPIFAALVRRQPAK